MCIVFIHVNPEPQENEYRLIVASNRDEFFRRAARRAYQCPKTGVIAGRDLETDKVGGTWLGFATKTHPENGKTTKHCFSCLTNIAESKVENATGRGRLIIDYLEGSWDYPDYVTDVREKRLLQSGYNFVAVELSKDGDAVTYQHSNTPQIDSVYTGKHTLSFSNTIISTPLMKVVNGREKFMEIIDKGLKKEELRDELVALLKDKTKHVPDKQLQKRGPRAEEMFSSIFVDISEAGYGTRTHTIVLIDKDWNLDFTEITMEEPIDPENFKWNTTFIKSRL